MPESVAAVTETVFPVPTALVAYWAVTVAIASLAALPESAVATFESVRVAAFETVAATVPSYTLVDETVRVPPMVTVLVVMLADAVGWVST